MKTIISIILTTGLLISSVSANEFTKKDGEFLGLNQDKVVSLDNKEMVETEGKWVFQAVVVGGILVAGYYIYKTMKKQQDAIQKQYNDTLNSIK